MLRFLADENFNGRIHRGLIRREPSLEIVRVQDVGLTGVEDPAVLAWAAEEQRVVLTHDVSTMTRYAYDRVRTGKAMPGVVEVPLDLSIGAAIGDILLLAAASYPEELEGRVLHLPF